MPNIHTFQTRYRGYVLRLCQGLLTVTLAGHIVLECESPSLSDALFLVRCFLNV